MPVAKICRNLTACLMILGLVGCSSLSSQPQSNLEFNRTEAVKARINLALAYLEQQDFPKAKENIDKALNHDSQDYLPYSVLAYYYQQTGEVEKADQTYQQALSLSQNRPDVRNNYGTFLCKQGHFEQAYSQFDLALTSDQPYYFQADTLENIALCAKSQNNQAKFEQTLAKLEKLDPARLGKFR